MSPLDFLNTAEKLMTITTPTEADIRSAISRSYYAVFHHVLSWWKSNHRFPDYRDRGHAKIQIALFNAGISTAQAFSRDLKDLNSERRGADYELERDFDLEAGQSILDLARRAIAAFDDIDKGSLSEGILDYLQKTNQI